MQSLGIIANPASGKDIRRLVSFATVIDNNEKVNIVKRIVLAAQAFGVERVYFMPDTFQMGLTVQEELTQHGVLTADIAVLEMFCGGSAADSTVAAKRMEELGVDCIAVLGGDGTSRAVAKGVVRTPLVPLSTGTNNVYPQMVEGTVAGMAAASLGRLADPYSVCIQDKRIEVWLNGQMVDLALIDAVISDDTYVGARAIWNSSRIRTIVVSRCHPATIGFSAVAGSVRIIRDTDPGGLAIDLASEGSAEGVSMAAGSAAGDLAAAGSAAEDLAAGVHTPGDRTPEVRKVKAAIAAGVVEEIGIREVRRLDDDEWLRLTMEQRAMVALDGEREVKVQAGDELAFRICRNGPWRVRIEEAVAMMMAG